eukprot:692165-Hanusia_phi.AAC.9
MSEEWTHSELDLNVYEEFLQVSYDQDEDWKLEKLFAVAFANQHIRRWLGMMCLADAESWETSKRAQQQTCPEEASSDSIDMGDLQEYCKQQEAQGSPDPLSEEGITNSMLRLAGSVMQFFSFDGKDKHADQPSSPKKPTADAHRARHVGSNADQQKLRRDFFAHELWPLKVFECSCASLGG